MIILLSGASDVGRKMLAEKLVKEGEKWKHLPLETVYESEVLGAIEGDDREEILARIACHCAQEIEDEGYSIALSHGGSPSDVLMFRQELDEHFVAIHLGSPDVHEHDDRIDEMYDYLIDSSHHSINDAFTMLTDALEKHRKKA